MSTHGSGYVKGCQCERCAHAREQARAYGRERSRRWRERGREATVTEQEAQHRQCKRCMQVLPLGDFGDLPVSSSVANCKRCRAYKAAMQRSYVDARNTELLILGKKPCTGPLCNGALKTFDEFYPDSTKPLGVSPRCKDCKNHARKQRYQAQLERERKRSRDYYAGNPGIAKTRYVSTRQQAIQIYGGQCEMCGDTRKLEFDHVNWDGAAHRMVEEAHAMVARIAKTGARITDHELRLVCGPCHRELRPTWTRRSLALKIACSNNWPTVRI